MKTILQINPDKTLSRIAPEIYGQFSEHLGRCIYDGIYVGEDSEIPNVNGMRKDVVEALRDLNLPVLRWPGGCFADEYHWRDGIGPKEKRRRMVNTNWGGTVEDNSFGTHEFMELCEQIGCEPYIAVNLGSGTVQEAAEWIEYMTADGDSTITKQRKENGRTKPWHLKYIGIGNENWGCGGNMSPDFYANEYKRYQSFCKNYGKNQLYKVACGPSAEDYNWTKELMSRIDHCHANGISLHCYTVPGDDWEHKGSATDFSDLEYYTTIAKALHIEDIIQKHLSIMDKYDPNHDIDLLVDEWGTWYDVEPGTNPGFLYQQNTMRDAIVAALHLNIFNKHSDRIAMANIAQVVNVLQAMILTEDTKILKTPTYDVFQMYKEHQGARLVESHIISSCCDSGANINEPVVRYQDIAIPALSESVSITEQNEQKLLTITLANTSLTDSLCVDLELHMKYSFTGEASVAMLHGDVHDCNTFDDPDRVRAFTSEEEWNGNIQTVTLPACSICRILCHVS